MVEAKPAAEKDSEDQDMPSAEAMPLEPADSALQAPNLPADGEVTTRAPMSFTGHKRTRIRHQLQALQICQGVADEQL